MNAMRISSNWITELPPNEIFVFGSNLEGRHCNGAVWGVGVGVGLRGQSYAIPTMQGGVLAIKPYVDESLMFASNHEHFIFLVTEIGCGIAGFTPRDIAPLFRLSVDRNAQNVYLPESFYNCYKNR